MLPLCIASCDRGRPGVGPTTRPGKAAVASLVPAATDLLLDMGARDRLVAVSNWDADRPEIAGLPKVGDYRTVDWEKLIELRPDVMVVQFRADKMPPGMEERAESAGIRLVNIRIVRLEDVLAPGDGQHVVHEVPAPDGVESVLGAGDERPHRRSAGHAAADGVELIPQPPLGLGRPL